MNEASHSSRINLSKSSDVKTYGHPQSETSEPGWQRFARIAAACASAAGALVLVRSKGEWTVGGSVGGFTPGLVLPQPLENLANRVLSLDGSLVLEDADDDADVCIPANETARVRAFAAMPVRNEQGNMLALIMALDRSPRVWSQPAVEALQDLATVFATKLQLRSEVKESSQQSVRLSSILEAATQVSMITTDLQGTITSFNGGAELLLGYGRDEMIGKQTPLVFHDLSEVADRARSLTAQLGSTVSGFETFIAPLQRSSYDEREWIYIRKDGSRRRVSLVVTPIRGERGRVVGYLGVAKDLTRVMLAEQKLHEFASLVEHSGDFIAMASSEGRLSYINPAGLNLIGLPAFDPRNAPLLTEFMDEATASLVLENVALVVASNRPWNGEGTLLHHHTRQPIRSEINLFPMGNSLAGGPNKLALILRDTTEKHEADARIRSSESRLRTILASSLDAFITIDHHGDVLEFNPAAERIFGFNRDDVIGKPMNELIIPERYRQAHLHGIKHFLKTGEGPVLGRLIELEAVRADGTSFPAELAIAPIVYGDGSASFTASLRDITERKAVERELRLAKEEAVEASRSKSEFLARMSHEVRTPMSAIIGYADMLLDPRLSLSERDHALQAIRRNSSHLLQLINDILDLSKIEAGKMDLDPIAYSPWQILMEIVSALRVRADERGIELEARASGLLPDTALIDPTRVRQVLVNLVGNAIKFSADRGRIQILVDAQPSDQPDTARLELTVIDQGIGMTRDQMDQLFIPFHQADTSTTRRFGGTGLGLSITKRLIDAMNGSIEVSSEPGKGSQFQVQFPVSLPPSVVWSEHSAEVLADYEGYTAARKPSIGMKLKGTVLLAEDSLDNQRVLIYHLKHLGLEVEVADNGAIAIERALRGGIDLILMDMAMPEVDGYGATSSLRRCGFTRPIIALTAHAMKEDRDRCIRTGCTDYMTKPVDPESLARMLAQHLPTNSHWEFLVKESAPMDRSSIISEIADDTDFHPLLRMYAESLTEHVGRLRAAFDNQDWPTMASLAHQTKGSGAMYGYPVITEISTYIERVAKDGSGAEAMRPLLRWFDSVVERVNLGLLEDFEGASALA